MPRPELDWPAILKLTVVLSLGFGALVFGGLFLLTGTAAWLYRLDFYAMVFLGAAVTAVGLNGVPPWKD